jgi:hypothetical protein
VCVSLLRTLTDYELLLLSPCVVLSSKPAKGHTYVRETHTEQSKPETHTEQSKPAKGHTYIRETYVHKRDCVSLLRTYVPSLATG